MLRVAFAVVLAVAVVGASMPVIETARHERSASHVEADLAVFETAVADLTASEEPALRPEAAARRTTSIDVPRGSFTTAPVEYVSIGGVPNRSTTGTENRAATPSDSREGAVLAYRIDGTTHVRQLSIEVRVLGADGNLQPAGTPLVLRGSHRVTLLLVVLDGDPVVVVTDGDLDDR